MKQPTEKLLVQSLAHKVFSVNVDCCYLLLLGSLWTCPLRSTDWETHQKHGLLSGSRGFGPPRKTCLLKCLSKSHTLNWW